MLKGERKTNRKLTEFIPIYNNSLSPTLETSYTIL